MNIKLLFVALSILLAGCSATKITTVDFRGDTIESSMFNHVDVVYAKLNIKQIKRELNGITKVNVYATTDKFNNLCSLSHYNKGRKEYTARYFHTSGNPVICSDKLSKQVSKNTEQADYIHAYWMSSIAHTINYGQQASKQLIGADEITNKFQPYAPYMNEIKLVASQYKRLKELNRKKNYPNHWIYRVSYNEFDQRKIYWTEINHQRNRSYDDISLAVECRKAKNSKGKLSLTWSSGEVITVPNKQVTMIAIIGDQPLNFDGKMYTNSYNSGFVSGRSKNFKLLLDHLIAGKPLKYRIETLNRDKFVEGFLPVADNIEGLLKVIDACSEK